MVLISRYFIRKMLDQDPWPAEDDDTSESNLSWIEFVNRLWKGRQKVDPSE
jgi:hypothetical protein